MGAPPVDDVGIYYHMNDESEAVALVSADGLDTLPLKPLKNGLTIITCKKSTAQNEGLNDDMSPGRILDGGAEAHNTTEALDGLPMGIKHSAVAYCSTLSNHPESSDGERVRNEASLKPDEPQKMGVNICEVCGRSFPSAKSLHGHMRCHPKRGWKGMTRPPGSKIRCSSPETGPSLSPPCSDSFLSRELSVSKWSVTARRGRKGRKALHQDQPRSPKSIAANTLLFMRYGSSLAPKPTMQPANESSQRVKRNSPPNDSRIEEHKDDSVNLMLRDVVHARVRWRHDTGRIKDEDIETNDQIEADKDEYRKPKKKRKKTEELDDVQDSSPTAHGERYRCTTCHKSFSCHQALGGHRASHKVKNISEEANAVKEIKGVLKVNHDEEWMDSNNEMLKMVACEHRCKQCNLTFSTGQALGGHMRRHWTGPAPVENATVLPLTTSESRQWSMLEFDLNELPKDNGGQV